MPLRPRMLRAETGWLILLSLVVATYFYGLGSFYAPTNGDEMVYIHIARMTAETGHWLPLQSEIIDTRNTKPPLLFWQAMVAGQWGESWSLWVLRLPSIAYTFATTALLALFTFKISGRGRTACLAAVLFLLYFSTFRYGRVYLTSAPETFWLALPMWWVLWNRLSAPTTSVAPAQWLGAATYTLFGIAFGLGAAYKSFALIAPAAAATWCAVLLSADRWDWRQAFRVTAGLGWSVFVGLGIFALWFALDPDPGAVWQEFIVAENAGKMSGSMGYWHAALFGAYPMWTQLLAYPENAGLLFFIALGLAWAFAPQAWKRTTYTVISPHQAVLGAWLLVWLVVFTLPSQRSARYVIPAMPALAIVMALAWERIARSWFYITLLICIPVLVMLARIGWVMGNLQIASDAQIATIMIALGAGFTSVTLGFISKNWCKSATLCSVLAVYASFSVMVAPLGEPSAGYSAAAVQATLGRRVAVPNGFTGQFERYQFVLPGAKFTPYDAEGRNTGAWRPDLPADQRLDHLLHAFDAVVWLQERAQDAPSCLPACELLDKRWHVKSRHKSGEITPDNLWYPDQWLFREEWLLRLKTH